jgi:hypothetical protein
MPLFKDIFPDAKVGDVINEVIKKTGSWGDCGLRWDGCPNKTNWVELTAAEPHEVLCCSTECAEKLIHYAIEEPNSKSKQR